MSASARPRGSTGEQRRAITTVDRDLAVSASAGAGKTRVLVERLVHLLESGAADLGQVAAITFTEKAAQEMKDRVRRRLTEREETPRRRRLAEGLEGAYISTIHGFCHRLLAEHPVEAGLDPDFTVLEPGEAGLVQREVADEVILAALGGVAPSPAAGPAAAAVASLVKTYGRAGLGQRLVAAYRQVRVAGLDLPAARHRTLAALRGAEDRFSQAAAGYRRLLDAILDREAQVAAAATKGALARLRAARPDALRALDLLSSAAAADPQVLDALKVVDETARLVKKNADRAVAGLVRELHRVADEIPGAWADTVSPPLIEAAFGLLEALERRYREEKDRRRSLDFEELQERALRLLGPGSPVRAAVRSRLRYVMVDELQDTDPLQEAILLALCAPERLAGAGPGAAGPRPNLMVVGDPVQSIYRFRGADVEVFYRLRRAIKAWGGEEVSLLENFRSDRRLVDFTNAVFTAVMEGPGGPAEAAVGVRAAEAARQARAGETAAGPVPAPAPEPNVYEPATAWRRAATDEPVVELVFPVPPDGAGADECRELEARALAARLRDVVEGGRARVWEETGAGWVDRPVRYGDIAVLFRAMTALSTFERALREHGVPYYTVGGRDYFHRQEVKDVVNLLRALERPGDPVALAGVLRSPCFGLSDETLFWFAQTYPERPWSRAILEGEVPSEVEPAEAARLERARRVIDRLRRLRNRVPLAQLIAEALEATDYLAVLATRFGGVQMVANVQKLVALAEGFEAREPRLLRDFLDHLEGLVEAAEAEPEAVVETEGAHAVKLLTIHRAKGLEFPVVAVADLARRFRNPGADLAFHPWLGLGLSVPGPGGRVASALLSRIREDEARRDFLEEQRLLYVALTRARDYLLLSGCEPRLEIHRAYGELPNWLGWICKVLDLGDVPAAPEILERGPLRVRLTRDVRVGQGPPPGEEAGAGEGPASGEGPAPGPAAAEPAAAAGRRSPLVRRYPGLTRGQPAGPPDPPDPGASASLAARVAAILRRAHPVSEPETPLVSLTATELLAAAECPRRYVLRYRLGVPEPGGWLVRQGGRRWGTGRDGSGEQEFDPLLRGRLVHRACQLADATAAGGRDAAGLLELALTEEGVEPGLTGTALEALVPLVEAYLASDLFREIAAAEWRLSEVPFTLKLAGDLVLRGQMDKVFGSGNRAALVDFKTDLVAEGDVPGRAEHYRPQLLAYELAARQVFGWDLAWTGLYFLQPRRLWRLPPGPAAPGVPGEARETVLALAGRVRALRRGEVPGGVSGQAGLCPDCPHPALCVAVGLGPPLVHSWFRSGGRQHGA